MSTSTPLNVTALQGTVMYGLAMFASGRAAWKGRDGDGARWLLWLGVCVGYLCLMIDIQLALRFEVKAIYTSVARAHGWYAKRRLLQVPSLLLVAVISLTSARAIMRAKLTRGQMLATLGSGVSLGCIVLELISLHGVDRILYTLVWPSSVIAWLWTLGAAAVVSGAILEVRAGASPATAPGRG